MEKSKKTKAEQSAKGEKKNKRYRAKVRIGTNIHTQEPVYTWISAHSPAELKKKVREAEEEARGAKQNSMVKKDSVLVADLAWSYYNTFKKESLSAAGKRDYENIIKNHIEPKMGFRFVTQTSIEDWQKFLNTYTGTSLSMGRKLIMVVKELCLYSVAKGLQDEVFGAMLRYLKLPATVEGERRELTDAETEAALWVGNNHPEGLLLLVLYYLGVRRGEALGLQWQDIDFENRTVWVRRDIDLAHGVVDSVKTQSSVRLIPLPNPLAIELIREKGVKKPTDFIFTGELSGKFLSQCTFKRRWNRLMRAMYEYDHSIEQGFEKVKDEEEEGQEAYASNGRSMLTPHYFRHNYCTLLFAAGIPEHFAISWMGHSNGKMVHEVYNHLRKKERMREGVKLVGFFDGCQMVATPATMLPKGV